MIEALVGNTTVEKILLYITNYQEGYISGIAETFHISKSQVRKQLLRLENGGILVARNKGHLRIYTFNTRCFYKNELENLLTKILSQIPRDEIEKILSTTPAPSPNRKTIIKISKKLSISEFVALVVNV